MPKTQQSRLAAMRKLTIPALPEAVMVRSRKITARIISPVTDPRINPRSPRRDRIARRDPAITRTICATSINRIEIITAIGSLFRIKIMPWIEVMPWIEIMFRTEIMSWIEIKFAIIAVIKTGTSVIAIGIWIAKKTRAIKAFSHLNQ